MTHRHSQFDGDTGAVSVPRRRTTGRTNQKQGPEGELGQRIEAVRERCGLLNRDMAQELGKELGTNLPQPTLLTWVRGAEPRRMSKEEIMQALDRIDARLGSKDGSTWTDKDEVAKQVQLWLEEMTHKQVAVASGELVQTISLWAEGRHNVLTRKWRPVKERVDSMLELLRKSGGTKSTKQPRT